MAGPSRRALRYQRRILGWGIGLVCVLYVVGAPIYLDRVERDLTDRVSAALFAAGFDGVAVSFSGQTGSIECVAPLADPQAAIDAAYAVRGVRAVAELPEACRVLTPDAGGGPSTTEPEVSAPVGSTTDPDGGSTTTVAEPTDFATVRAVLDGSPQFALLAQLLDEAGLTDVLVGPDPLTLFAPTDTAFDALPADGLAQLRGDPELLRRVLEHHLVSARLTVDDLVPGPLATMAGDDLEVGDGAPPTVDGAAIVDGDLLAANGVVHAVDALLVPAGVDLEAAPLASVVATWADGAFVLEGVVRSEVERAVLLDAIGAVVPPPPVTDELTTDPDVGLDAMTTDELAAILAAMPSSLVDGRAGFDGTGLVLTGTYTDDAARDAIAAIAEAAGATVSLTERPDATGDDAVDLEAELNAYVADNPILFAPSSDVLDDSALPILDELARRVRALGGIAITVEGHTDSDGIPIENLALSQRRAEAVRAALVDRGVDAASITAEGFGSTVPILVEGVEDKGASRRVEFRVEARS